MPLSYTYANTNAYAYAYAYANTYANTNTNANANAYTYTNTPTISDMMKYTIPLLIIAVILIGGGALVAGITHAPGDKVSQSQRDIEAPSEGGLGTNLTVGSIQEINGEVTSLTTSATLMSIAETTTMTLVRVDSGEVTPGGSITVPVTAENMPAGSPVAATTIEVRYDPSVLDATACDVDPNDIFDSAICNPDFDNDAVNPDIVRFNATSVAGVSGTFLLANITFGAVGQSGDTSVVDVVIVVLVDPLSDPVSASDQDSQVCLTPCAAPDGDGDGVPDVSDNCPDDSNPGQENTDADLGIAGATMGGVSIGDALGDACDDDDDDDGYLDVAEAGIGTADDDNCTNFSGPGPGPNTDAWPSDMNAGDSVNLSDITGPFKPHFGTIQGVDPTGTGTGEYNPRVDLNLSGSINLSDITGPFKPDFGKGCW